MPKVNVYLPADLAAEVRRAGLPVSAVCQQALAEAVGTARASREAAGDLRDPAFDAAAHPEIEARMTPRLREAVRRAHALGDPVEPGDLLCGLAGGDNLGIRVLQALGVELPAVAPARGRAIEPLLAGLSAPARDVLAAAHEGAAELGHGFLGCEHLVLGLAERTDLLGVPPERVRRAIPAALGAATLGHATVAQRLDAIEARLAAGGL